MQVSVLASARQQQIKVQRNPPEETLKVCAHLSHVHDASTLVHLPSRGYLLNPLPLSVISTRSLWVCASGLHGAVMSARCGKLGPEHATLTLSLTLSDELLILSDEKMTLTDELPCYSAHAHAANRLST